MHKKRIFKFFRHTVCAALAVSMLAGEIGNSLGTVVVSEAAEIERETECVEEEINASIETDYGLADNTKDGVILHAFCWSFNTIKENMKDIAEAGYTTVQTSPANACNDSHPQMKLWSDNEGTGGCWWWHYQPTDWTIGNYQLGTKEDYAAMCKEADKYGVKIITDVIPNHTTPDLSRVSGSLANTGGGLGAGQLYHANGFSSIQDYGDWSWGNRLACTTGMMGGLPDVNTENQAFQAYYLKYCNDLIELGCDGFRYDTAKHIGVPSDPKDSANTRGVNDFWDIATGKKSVNGVTLSNANNMFIYGEVLQGDNVPTSEYAGYMYQTASSYGYVLREAIKNKDFSTGKLGDWCHTNPDKVVSWVESHDTYCNNHESGWMTDWDIKMSWAVIAARKDGTPLFMSRPDGSNGSAGNYWGNNVLGAKGNDHFKDSEIVAVNKFRTAMAGEGEYLRNPNGNSQILQIDRGTKGTCIINLGGSTSISNNTTMADGTYTDQVSGREFTVSNGKISGQLDGGKIAVIYNAYESNAPRIAVSIADGTSFSTDTLDVTISTANADSVSYSVDNGTRVAINNTATVTIGKEANYGDTITINVIAKNAAGEIEKNYTYIKVDPTAVNKAQIVLPSGWSEPVYCYAYDSETEKINNGSWPGVQMTKVEGTGNVYEYTIPDNISKPRVIFYSSDSNRSPADMEKGYLFESDKATYRLENGTWKKVVVTPIATETPTPSPTETPTPSPTETPTPTLTDTIVPTAPLEYIVQINSSLENGSEFYGETETITLTAQLPIGSGIDYPGTYSVDGGPQKEFEGSVEVEIGKGKIADSEITVKVSAGKVERTFTYKKVYTPVSICGKENVAEEETTVEEASVNAVSDTRYATNPSGQVGTKKTITCASDFDESMIIAQGVANDDPAIFRGSHEAPKFDLYAMYGAWDDTNLYIGLQYTNVIDVVDPAQSAPQTGRGKPNGADADIPQMLVFDTGSGDYTDGTANDTKQKTAWDIDVKYSGDAKVDKVFLYSPKDGIVNQALFSVTDGVVDYNTVVKSGYNMPAIPGVSTAWEDGFFGSHMYGIKSNGYSGYTPADLTSTSANWTDFLTEGHNEENDTFCIVTLPLKLLGVTATDIQNNGIGVMSIASYGASGIGSLPMDMTMLDNATEAYSQDASTSHEKEDSDVVTEALARLGGRSDITVTPILTVEPTVTETPTPTIEPIEDMHVNFGADRSAPQYNTTELTLKAIAQEGTAPYTYEFFIDGKSVQKGESDTYKWQNDIAGTHNIGVSVTDREGQCLAWTKEYDLETEGEAPTATIMPTVTVEPTVTIVPTVTENPIPTSEPQLMIMRFNASQENAKVADEVVLEAAATCAKGTELYMFSYILDGKEVVIKPYSAEASVAFKPETEGIYELVVYVVDERNEGIARSCISKYVVSENIPATPTEKPTITIEPTITVEPTVTVEPIITVEPTITIEPTVTVEPTITMEPIVTVEPTITIEPTVTVEPTVTAEPTVTVEPTITIEPTVTVEPTVTAEPTITTEPTITVAPTITEKPTIIVEPTVTIEPTVTGKPTVTLKPTVTIKPTITVEPTATVKPTATPTQKPETLKIKSFEMSKASNKARVGDKIKLIAKAAGGEGKLSYQFTYTYKGKETIICNYSKKNNAYFKPKKAGKYSLTVSVKDSTGKVVDKTIKSYKVKEKFVVKDMKLSCKGKKVTVKTVTQGAIGKVKYKYLLKLNGETIKSTSYKSNKSFTARCAQKGTYKLTVYAKDGTDKIAKKTIRYKVK